MTENTWDRTKVKKVLDVLKEMKNFDRLPLPNEIHKAFDIPLNKSKNLNVMEYFERYLQIQNLPADVETIDGSVIHKDVVFPTSILKPFELPDEYKPDLSVGQESESKDDLSETKGEKRPDTPIYELDLPLLKED